MASPPHPSASPNAPTQEDLAQLEQVLQQVMLPDNEIRSSAEAIFAGVKQSQPSKLCLSLLEFSARGGSLEIRQLAAVLLRRVLAGKDSIWDRIGDIQSILQTALIQSLMNNGDQIVRKRIGDVISMLGSKLIPKGGWNELLPTLFRLASSETPSHRESSLEVFGELVCSKEIAKAVIPHTEMMGGLFHQNLAATNELPVRVASMRAATAFVVQTDTKTVRNAFRPLTPLMIDTFNAALTAHDEPVVDEAIEMLIELADNQPLFFRNCVPATFETTFTLAKTCEWLNDNTRYLALEFLLSLAENAPNMVKKVPNYLPSIITLSVEWTTLEEDKDMAEWNSAEADDASSPLEVTYVAVGADALDRLSQKLGGQVVLPIVSTALGEMLTHANWKVRNGAMTVLCHVAEGCKTEMEDNLDQVVDAVLARLGDEHARVRHGACVCIAQWGLDFIPHFQYTYHARIIPLLIQLIQADGNNSRVIAHAAAAIINMVRAMNVEILQPYIDPLLTSLGQLLQFKHTLVLQHAITGIAAMSIPMGQHFVRYYDQFMPYIKSVIQNARGKSLRLLRGKAMECASMIGLAVGAERFAADAKSIMDLLVSAHSASNDSTEDELNFSYLHRAYTRILQLMGQDFAPYLPIVLPGLLRSAAIEPDVGIIEGDIDPQELDGWDVYQAGGQYVAVHTSAMEEKATACQMLFVYVQQLKDAILPWVGQITDVGIPLLKFVYHADVRSAMLVTFPELVKSVAAAEKNGMVSQGDTLKLVNLMLPKLIESIEWESNTAVLYDGVDALKEMVIAAGTECLTMEQVEVITRTALSVIVKMANEMVGKDEKEADEDADDLAGGADAESDDDEAGEEDVITQAQAVFSACIKTFKAAYFPLYETLVAGGMTQLNEQGAPLECQWVSLCAMDDLIEFASPESHQYLPLFLPVLLQHCNISAPPLLRQAAIYGIGVAAQYGGTQMDSFVQPSVEQLIAIVQHPEARQDSNEQPSDNAIVSLGKFAQYRGMNDVAAMMLVWFKYLPLKNDEVEWRNVLVQLCQFIEASNVHIIGLNGVNIPHIVTLLADGLTQEFTEDQKEEEEKWLNHQRGVVLNMLATLNTNYGPLFEKGWALVSPSQKAHVTEQQQLHQQHVAK